MKKALRDYSRAIRAAGFDHDHPDDVEAYVKQRLDALTEGGSTPIAELSPEKAAALKELQDYERRVAVKSLAAELKYFEPVEERIQREMFARQVH